MGSPAYSLSPLSLSRQPLLHANHSNFQTSCDGPSAGQTAMQLDYCVPNHPAPRFSSKASCDLSTCNFETFNTSDCTGINVSSMVVPIGTCYQIPNTFTSVIFTITSNPAADYLRPISKGYVHEDCSGKPFTFSERGKCGGPSPYKHVCKNGSVLECDCSKPDCPAGTKTSCQPVSVADVCSKDGGGPAVWSC